MEPQQVLELYVSTTDSVSISSFQFCAAYTTDDDSCI